MNHTESDVEITAALPSGMQARLAQAQPARLKRSTALQEASTLVIRHINHLFVFYGCGLPYWEVLTLELTSLSSSDTSGLNLPG